MCGRYELHATPREIQDHFGDLISAERWRRFTASSGYNIAPSLSVPIIRYSTKMAERSIDRAVWGFRPQWAKRAWINARAETLFTTTAFRESAAKRRCLVPATGWYEWRDTGDR